MKTLLTVLIGLFFTQTQLLNAQEIKKLKADDFKKEIWNYTQDKEWKYLGNQPAIIDLYADWCPPCRQLSPVLEQIQQEYGTKLQIYKINVDQEPKLASLFHTDSIPLMVFITKDGKMRTIKGFRPKQQLEQLIAEMLEIEK